MAKHRAWVAGDYAIVSNWSAQYVVRVIEAQADGMVRVIRQYPREHQLEKFEDMRSDVTGDLVPTQIIDPALLTERVEQY